MIRARAPALVALALALAIVGQARAFTVTMQFPPGGSGNWSPVQDLNGHLPTWTVGGDAEVVGPYKLQVDNASPSEAPWTEPLVTALPCLAQNLGTPVGAPWTAYAWRGDEDRFVAGQPVPGLSGPNTLLTETKIWKAAWIASDQFGTWDDWRLPVSNLAWTTDENWGNAHGAIWRMMLEQAGENTVQNNLMAAAQAAYDARHLQTVEGLNGVTYDLSGMYVLVDSTGANAQPFLVMKDGPGSIGSSVPPVPEPATWGALLLGVALTRRARKPRNKTT